MSRAFIPQSEEDAAKLTLAELNARIATATWRFATQTGNLKKTAFKTLVKLEAIREELHGVPAPARRLRSRG